MLTKTLKIHVTAADIRNGVRADTACCPVALATQRLLCNQLMPHVSSIQLLFHTYDDSYIRYDLSRSAQRFISRFDNKFAVKPFTFIARKQA